MPSELRQRLLEPGVYRVQSRKRGGERWYEAAIARDDYVETVIWAALLRQMSPTLELEIEHVGDQEDDGNQPEEGGGHHDHRLFASSPTQL